MSFEFDNNQKSVDFESVNAEQNANLKTQTVSQNTLPPSQAWTEDIAIGVRYYWRASIALIFYSILWIIGSICLTTNQPTEDGFNIGTIVEYAILLIGVFIWIPMMKAMILLAHVPDTVFPGAKKSIIVSWILWGVGVVLSFGFVVPTKEYFIFINFVSWLLYGISALIFYTFINKLGQNILPDKKGCILAIIFMSIYYFFSALISLGGKDTSQIQGLGTIAFIGAILYLNYIYKIKAYFESIFDMKQLLKQRKQPVKNEFGESQTRSSGLSWGILWGGLIIVAIFVIRTVNSTSDNIKLVAQQQAIQSQITPIIEQMDKIEKEALTDWDVTFVKFSDKQISNKQFGDWIENTHLPAWEKCSTLLENVEAITGGSKQISFYSAILQDRIEYCKDYLKAIENDSPKDFNKAMKKMYRSLLKCIKNQYEDDTPIEPNVIQDYLNWAVFTNSPKMVKWIIQKGADINKPNSVGVTPLEMAKSENNSKMVELLKSLGAKDDNEENANAESQEEPNEESQSPVIPQENNPQ